MVVTTNSRKCTGWHLHKNVAENLKHIMTISHDPRETTASSSVKSRDEVANKVLRVHRGRGQPKKMI